jgi:AraC-like DNA-binding protein
METAFYISNILLLLVISVISIFMFHRARKLNDEPFQLRRRSFLAFYLLLALHVATSFDIVTSSGTEVFATLPICTQYFVFTTFTMVSSAYFGRSHHRKFFVWFNLLQYPCIMLVIHLFMRLTERYQRVYSMNDIIFCRRGELHVIFLGRLAFLAVIVVCFFFMMYMLIDAYGYYCRQQKGKFTDEKRISMRHNEILNIGIYTVLLTYMLSTFLMPFLVLHVISNILMIMMICRTYYVYTNFMRYSEEYSYREEAFDLVARQIATLSEQERGNPIYRSNSSLEEVADALCVDRKDFSDYLYERLNTTFSTWMSEKKIMHFTSQLVLTDRKINELAVACGYANVTSLNRAFKSNFGVTPSEYRDQHQH